MRMVCPVDSRAPVSSLGRITGSNSASFSALAENRSWVIVIAEGISTLTNTDVPTACDESLQLPIAHAPATASTSARTCNTMEVRGWLMPLIEH